MRTFLKRIGITVIVALVLMQLYRPARTNPEVEPGHSIEALLDVDHAGFAVIRQACFDCHSNETDWPWYTNVAPVSWFVIDHVDHAREHMNFSEWARLDAEGAEHKLEEICEEVEEGEMPLASYKLMHPEGRLTDEQTEEICRWTAAVREALTREDPGAF